MKRLREPWLCIGFILVLAFPVWAQSPSIPMGHWMYEFLNRLESKRILPPFFSSVKPYTRKEVAGWLAPLVRDPEKRARLNPVELRQLRYLQSELREELEELGVTDTGEVDKHLIYLRRNTFLKKLLPDFLFSNNRNAFTYRETGLALFGDLILYDDLRREYNSFQDDRDIERRKWGISLWGELFPFVQFAFRFTDATERGGDYPEENPNWTLPGAGFAAAHGSYVNFDETEAALYLGGKIWQLTFGKEKNRWGPGQFGNLMLSDEATSYDQLRLKLTWKRVQFTYIAGILQNYPPIFDHSYYTSFGLLRQIRASKYLAAHRFEFMPSRSLIVGVQESVVYGERNMEWAYLNPLNFYWSAEHHLGDQDNAALGMDITWFPVRNWKLYAELLLDDLQTGKLGTDWYGNKWGILAGANWVDFANVPNLDFYFEWVRIRPYVYSHFFPINVYKHFDTPLGYRMGPNSQAIETKFVYRPVRRLRCALSFESLKHGANPPGRNVGGDINRPHVPNDPEQQKMFDGIVQRQNNFWLECSYELFRDAFLTVEFGYLDFSNFQLSSGQFLDGYRKQIRVRFSWNHDG